jgi:hypothetical protein
MIKVTGKTLPKVKDTGRGLARVEASKVVVALGAEPASGGVTRPQGRIKSHQGRERRSTASIKQCRSTTLY